jgi:hypoxanthine-DNA glycosylase
MKAVLGWRELPENYQEKRRLLLKAGIGLWDIIKSCERKGADDNRIRNEKINDLPGLIQRYPRIKTVFCNGRKSYDLCKELCGHNIHIKYLPSSSPAHAIRLSAKTKKWMIIKKCLKNT